MTKTRLNYLTLICPLLFSAIAFLLVIANIAARVPPGTDENASAHVFQLLIALEVPVIGVYLLSSDWRTARPLVLFGLQVLAIAIAFLPVWLAGY